MTILEKINMNIRNEINAHIVQEGTTMSEVAQALAVVTRAGIAEG